MKRKGDKANRSMDVEGNKRPPQSKNNKAVDKTELHKQENFTTMR